VAVSRTRELRASTGMLLATAEHQHSSCQSISLLLDTESGLKESLSRIGQEEQVELLLNRVIRLEEHVSGTSR
jgi:ribosomal protein S15P/S13E